MLRIQTIIRDYPDWQDILSKYPYNLSIRQKGDLFKFNYTKESIPCVVTNEARALILDKNGNIIAKSFNRFFNMNESYAATIDWKDEITVEEKIDGTLIELYWYNGWHIATRSSFDAKDFKVNDKDFSFEDLFYDSQEDLDFKIIKLDKDKTYVFELVSPYSKIVVDYKNTESYLLSVFSNITGIEMSQFYIDDVAKRFNFKQPKKYKLRNSKEIESFVKKFSGKEFEGVVVKDCKGHRVKIKNPFWLELHHLSFNGTPTIKQIIKMIIEDNDSEFLSYFPEYELDFDNVKQKMDEILYSLKDYLSFIKLAKDEKFFESDKEFWETYIELQTDDNFIRSLLMKMFKGKMDVFTYQTFNLNEWLKLWKGDI